MTSLRDTMIDYFVDCLVSQADARVILAFQVYTGCAELTPDQIRQHVTQEVTPYHRTFYWGGVPIVRIKLPVYAKTGNVLTATQAVEILFKDAQKAEEIATMATPIGPVTWAPSGTK